MIHQQGNIQEKEKNNLTKKSNQEVMEKMSTITCHKQKNI